MWRGVLPETPSLVVEAPADPLILHSQPLPAGMIVRSDPRSVELVTSSASAVAVAHSCPAERLYETICDAELRAFFSRRPVVLIRHSPTEAQLIFPSDPN